jgi:hypothetical protein
MVQVHSDRRDQSGLNGCCTAMWKANGKITTLYFPCIFCFQKRRYHICEMLLVETKQLSGGKLLPRLDLPGGIVSRGQFMQVLRISNLFKFKF